MRHIKRILPFWRAHEGTFFVDCKGQFQGWIQHFVFKDAEGFYVYFSQGIAFVLGLIANFILSKLFVFQEKSEKTNAAGEFAAYAVIGVVGLLIKELLLWVFNIQIGWHYMLVWVFSTLIVLVWNYAARKVLLYRKKK